jgi:hypothetical protein
MNERSIVLYLARKNLWATEIDSDRGLILESDAKGYSSVTRFLCEAKFHSPNPPTAFSEGNPSLDDSNEALLQKLKRTWMSRSTKTFR